MVMFIFIIKYYIAIFNDVSKNINSLVYAYIMRLNESNRKNYAASEYITPYT